MNDGLAQLALLALMFVGSHIILSHPPVRKFLIYRWTIWPFRVVYSTISAIFFIQMIAAYGAASTVVLFRHGFPLAPLILMGPAAILVVCGYTIANPSAVGLEDLAKGKAIPGILKITRQPIMWGVALFALSHLAAKPDAAAWIFYGSLVILALAGGYHLDRRKQAEDNEDWKALSAQSSFVPFAAILDGRARVTFGEIGWWRLVGGLALFGSLMAVHEMVFGVSPLPPGF